MVVALLLTLLAAQPDSAGFEAGAGGLVFGRAESRVNGDELRLGEWEHRTRIRLELFRGEGLSVLAEPSVFGFRGESVAADSLEVGLDRLLVRARLPGTPWLGGEVFHGCRQPFLPSLEGAYLDLTETEADSLSGMSLTAGGFLGFRGSYSLYRPFAGDTMSYAAIRAPWAGFGTFRAYRFTRRGPQGEVGYDALEGWLSIMRFSPWMTVLRSRGDDGGWAAGLQLREIGLRPSLDLRLEVTPEARLAGDSLRPGTGGLCPGQRTAGIRVVLRSLQHSLAAWGYGRVDFEDMVEDSAGVGLYMLSSADIEYTLSVGMAEAGDPDARLDADLRRPLAGAGAGLRVMGDSLRVAGRASYTPRPDVHGTMELSGSPAGELDPVGSVAARVASGGLVGGISLTWEEGEVSMGVDLVAEVMP